MLRFANYRGKNVCQFLEFASQRNYFECLRCVHCARHLFHLFWFNRAMLPNRLLVNGIGMLLLRKNMLCIFSASQHIQFHLPYAFFFENLAHWNINSNPIETYCTEHFFFFLSFKSYTNQFTFHVSKKAWKVSCLPF